MPKFIKKRSKKAGLPPGSLVHIGEKTREKVKVTALDYNLENVQEKEIHTLAECIPFRESATVTWVNVDSIHDTKVIQTLGECFKIHPLVQEDILNTDQRPKMADFGGYLFVVVKMLRRGDKNGDIIAEQVSLIVGSNFLLSFQEGIKGDVFESIRTHIRAGAGRIRQLGTDYLAYSLLDAIVDNYFVVLEQVGEHIELLEEKLVKNPQPETLKAIHQLKRELIFLRKSVWPLREVVSALQRKESLLIKDGTITYLRDVYDHTIQVIDAVEAFRDIVSGMLEMYLSSMSHRLNEVMKVLTVIATIFMPLTFLAGVYGMNFHNMPELSLPWGYPVALLIMFGIGLSMAIYFKRKGWL